MSIETGRLTILHLSDVHATEGELLYGSVDGLERLDRVGAYARETGITPELVVVTGDLAQRGNPGAYPAIERALRRLEEALSAPVLTVLGNHDDPVAARVLTGHGAGHARVVHVGGLRVILLDSSTGALDAVQLQLVRDTLRRPFGLGTVVALHHAPLGSPLPTLAQAGLRDPAALLDALTGGDVRIVLAGHFHHALSATLRGIAVSVGPSLAYHQVMNAGPDLVSGHDASMFSLVHLTEQSVSTSSFSLRDAVPLFTAPVRHAVHTPMAS
ncbi:MAG TPA: metallophosphoesterase [Plantibacter sp.]|uniref:metallophosphoesterase n=1 Tax=unclassified Plantibacter TaxID=2624265 RepID=UPI002C2ECB7E|nr:metallophosphoesterase [Plantibacter sp.]